MGYLSAWKVLEEMVADFRKKGMTIPAEIMGDLKSAKTLINVLKADTSYSETIQKIDEYFFKVESYLGSEGQKIFGTECVEKWLRRLDEAGRKTFDEEEEETRFVPGIPREQKWIRVKLSAELTADKLKSLAKGLRLSFTVQKDGYLIVYGKDEHVKEFVKKMATKYKTKT